MSDSTFDVIPTEDGLGYWIELCRSGECVKTFVSSMHLTGDHNKQLERALDRKLQS